MQAHQQSRNAVRLVVEYEVRHFFSDPRNLLFFPLLVLSVPLALSRFLTPLVPAAAIALILLARQFMEMFDQRGREFPKFAVLPLAWEAVILGKGIAAMLLALLVAGLAGIVFCWLHPAPPSLSALLTACIPFCAVIIPVLQAGASTSVIALRTASRSPLDPLLQAGMTAASAGVAGVPVILLSLLPGYPLFPALYCILLFTAWIKRGIPVTAGKIRQWQLSREFAA